jgi:PTS system ascorbate-specific IIA component
MVSLLIVAHAPLASALRAAAEHVYAERCRHVACVDVEVETTPEAATAHIAAALTALGEGPVLVLVDTFGATPCNAAQLAVAQRSAPARVVAGVNVPMLWRTLCYADVPLEDLVARAVAGGMQGVMPVSVTKRQNQPVPPLPNDQAAHQHQQ